LLLLAARAGAQQYDLRTFSLEQGLPSAAVNAICEDADGFLWLATDQGLARSQGSRFEAFDEQQGAPATEATALLPTLNGSSQGRLLTGYRNGALAWWSKGRFTSFTTTPTLPAHAIRTILAGQGATVVLGTRGGGVWQVDTVTHKATALNAGLASLRINGLVHHGKGLLAATDSGLFQLEGARWTLVSDAELAKGTRALSLHADSIGVLVGTDHGYVELDQQLRPVPIAERVAGLQPLALPHAVVLSILRAGKYDLWLGTPAGLVHLARENGVPKLTSIKEANGLGHDLVRCLHRDRSGGIWAGTGFGGVSKFTSDAFQYITEKDGLGSRIVSAIHRTADGLLWIGTQGGGISHFDGTRIRHYEREDGLPSLFITCLGEDAEGYLLAGTSMHGLHRNRYGRFEQVWAAGDREAQRVNDVATLADGTIVIASGSGVHWVNGTKPLYTSLVGRSANALLVAGDTLWCATDSGLFVTSLAASAVFTRVNAVPALAINAMARDSKGNLWLGTATNGLLRWRGGKVETFGREAGLESLAVMYVQLDAFENLWLGTRQGIHQVELDVMQEQVLSIRAFGPEDGFIGLESLRGASMLDGDSSLWFGTVRGATRFDAQQVVDDTQEPLVHLTDLQLFYERPDWSPWCAGMSRNGFPSDLHLPHDKNHLTFAFTGISLAYPEKVRYRWILEGYDPDWSRITATQRVTYSNIPPGEYTFKVMARNASGIWNEKPVTYTFTIAPPFWRTTPFLAGGGVTLLLGFAGFVRLRERNQRRERDRLERMVKVRTSQLAEEKERSDELLRNILPASTAEELKQKGSAEAHRYESCTVLFSDFKGFTGFSSLMDSDTLVSELDHYFRLFDEACDRYGLEKIKTIGDAYMCAAGIPEPKATHARDAVLMGLAMIEAVDQSNADRRSRGMTEWPVRIGIHTGPVVAGVVGRKKFAYDIWGDTVNLASRMESHSEAGKLNISGATYAQVMDLVHVQPRGPIKVKGKGELHMYFVTGLKEGVTLPG
ncbi:MAG TPA: adenylate/guanylate cyclase domain-containing protein, partial [Flavobacteriales bacterium]|nr:adenylate/guanylate cyclase domain-containing protein [Flavobacteriales bacterium]